MGGQPDADVGDQRRPARRALLEHVEDVAPVQDGEVGALPGPVDEVGERPARDPLERLLADVAAADLEGGDPEPVAVLVGEVDHEALVDHRAEQVVRRAARQLARAHDAVEGTGSGWLARKRSTRRVRVAAGTWLMGRILPPAGGRPRSTYAGSCRFPR